MDDNHYKVDRNELALRQEEQATESLNLIEKKCDVSPATFLKENYSSVKIRKSRHEPFFRPMIAVMLTKICALAGIKSEVDSFNVSDINNFILRFCGDLAIEEIFKAFELERFGSYKDKTEHYNLFNADYVSSVIKKYRNWKLETKTLFNISNSKALPEITEAQKKEIVDQGIIRVFEEYKLTKKLPEPNAYIFDELFERKIIKGPITPKLHEYYISKVNQAEEELKKEISDAKKITSGPERKKLEEVLNQILSGDSEKTNLRTKRIILSEYFEKLIAEKIDIHSIILNQNERDSKSGS